MKKSQKKITLTLAGLDGNAFSLMGAFQRQAQREKWTKDEIKTVLDEVMTGDYNHLLATLMAHCNDADEDSNDDFDNDD